MRRSFPHRYADAWHLAFYSGEHAHGEKNTNDLPGGSRWIPARPGFGPGKRLQNAPGIPGPGRPGFSKTGGKGTGRKRSVWVAESLVGTGGKSRERGFLVCVNGRVSPAGSQESGPKTPVFTPGVRGSFAGFQLQQLQHGSGAGTPITKCCARTGLAQETLRFGRRVARWDGRKIPWMSFSRLLERARLLSRFPEKGAKNTCFHSRCER